MPRQLGTHRSPARGALDFSLPPPSGPSLRAYEPTMREQIAQFFADRAADLGADRSTQQYISDKIADAVDIVPAVGEVLGMDDSYREYVAGNYGSALATLGITAIGAVPVVGDAAAAATKAGIRGFHGSAADFDSFSTGFAKSGTGAQSEGRGLYFSTDREAAEGYRDKIAGEKGGKGRVYEVDINARPEQFYDLDKPLSQQNDEVRSAYAKAFGGEFGRRAGPDDGVRRGDTATLNRLSESMEKAGIKGTTWNPYVSGQTRNYSVFDPSILEIVGKYGVAGASAIVGYDVLSGLSEAQASELESHAPVDVDPMTTGSTKGGVSDFAGLLLGEAGGKNATERYNDMLHIASVVVNRAQATGLPVEDIMANSTEFNAWGKALPAGTDQYRALAEQAIQQVIEHGPVTDATFYATPSKTDNLPAGLQAATSTASHQFFTDPQGRAIGTARGYAPVTLASIETTPPLPLTAPSPYGPLDMRMEQFRPQYADIVPPTTVPSLPAVPPAPNPAPREIVPGAGLANLAPNGLPPAVPDFGRIAGKGRNGATNAELNSIIDGSIKSVMGPDWTFAPYSGSYSPEKQARLAATEAEVLARGLSPHSGAGKQMMQAAGQIGSTRHNQGNALDFDIFNPSAGQYLQRGVHDVELNDISREAGLRGIKGYGYGRGYMDGGGATRFHMDTERDAQWGARNSGANVDPEGLRAFLEGRAGFGATPNQYSPGGIPTPTARDIGMAMPSVPTPSVPNFAGGQSPRGAPSAMPSPPAMPNFSGGASPRTAQETSMAMYGLTQPREAPPAAMPFAPSMPGVGPFAPATPGGPITMAPPAPPMTPAPPVNIPSPYRPDNANYQGPRGNFAVPTAPSLPMNAPIPTPRPDQIALPNTAPIPQMPPAMVNVPQMAPTPNPRNGYNDMRRAAPFGIGPALMAPGAAQIGRNIRSNAQGQRIGMFAGVPQAYRSAFTGLGNRLGEMFGGGNLPAPTPFSVGSGLGAIQSVIGGGQAPGATAYSRSDPNVSFSVNQYGLVERDDGRFSGVWNG